ncbi:hypothetical protein PSHT_06362 [Puccinia striiformis]|uniref:Uncharacterized protein n=1 Tax=Puccinia striiformis TaxID=27350 RepID=A0A2S4W6V4_9BASI|nr:hypothetical protein PSHT_06362 [Puccinia striiformis]
MAQPATANRRISSRLALKTQPIISNEKMDTSNQQPTRNHQPEEQIKASDIDETENDVKDPKNEVEDPKNEVEQDPYFSPSPSPIPQRRPKRAASPPPPQKPADFSPESSASPIPVRRSKPRPVSPTPAATSTPIDQLHHSNPTASKRSKTHTLSPPPSKSPSLDHHQIKPENTRSSVPQIKPGNNQSGPVAQRPKPIRPQRPIKRALKQTDTTSIPTHDDDDFFNLSSRKQIQFVSKTLGLKGTPTGVAPNSDHEGSDNPDSKTKGECDNIPKPRKGKGRAMPVEPKSRSPTLLQHPMRGKLVAKTTKQARDKYERPIRFEMKSIDVVYQKFHQLTGIPIKVYDLNSWTYVCTERRQRARIASQGVEGRDHEEVIREDLENLPLETNSTTETSPAAEGGEMEDIEMTGPDQDSTNNGNGGGQTINLTFERRTKLGLN